MNDLKPKDLTSDDLVALAASELRSQEAIFARIGEDIDHRQTLLVLLSDSLRQYFRLRKITNSKIELVSPSKAIVNDAQESNL